MRRAALPLSVLLLLGLMVAPARAQGTDVSGSITSDTSWTESGSPYVLNGEVTVAEGATLTIEPGVEVRARETSALIVLGAIEAKGSESQPIELRAEEEEEEEERGSWKGLQLGSPGSAPAADVLEWVTISDAATGLSVANRLPHLDALTLDGNGKGLELKNPSGHLTIANSVFMNNTTAVTGRTRETVELRHNDFWNNVINLLPAPQSPFDCGSDAGTWVTAQNDILRGPVNAEFWSYDVHTPEGSRNSPYVVNATDNWWGTTEDVDGRLTRQFGCCPAPFTKEIAWSPVSTGPHTTWTPPGEVPEPGREGIGHSDPGTITTVSHPRHSSCMDATRFTRVRGVTTSALAPVEDIHVAVSRLGRRGFRELDGRVIEHDDGWIYKLREPARAGRYEVVAYGQYEPLSLGRNVIHFRLRR